MESHLRNSEVSGTIKNYVNPKKVQANSKNENEIKKTSINSA